MILKLHKIGKWFKLLTLIKPSTSLKEDFLSMILEYRAKSEFFVYHDLAMMDFSLYLKDVRQVELGQNLRPGYVPQSTYWLVQDNQTILGESRLRHTLSPSLEIEGGHIGYAIRPSKRLQGHGTQILKFTLIEAAKLGLERVLLTCNAENIGSRKIIEANGGVFDGENISPDSRKWVQRFWVPVP
jgi:predicted acetyltransferase